MLTTVTSATAITTASASSTQRTARLPPRRMGWSINAVSRRNRAATVVLSLRATRRALVADHDEHRAGIDGRTLLHPDIGHNSAPGRTHLVLHLHGFENGHRLSLCHFVSGFDEDGHDAAGHRRHDMASARPAAAAPRATRRPALPPRQRDRDDGTVHVHDQITVALALERHVVAATAGARVLALVRDQQRPARAGGRHVHPATAIANGHDPVMLIRAQLDAVQPAAHAYVDAH